MTNKPNKNHINCIQINLQRSKRATPHLLKTIEEYDIDIVLVQEPHIIGGKVIGFPLKHSVIYNRQSTHPKTAIILINNLIQSVFIQSFSSHNLTIINCEFMAKSLVIFNAYFSPFEDLNEELNQIQTAINTLKPNHYIICFDSNSHSRVWFNDTND